MGKKGKTGIGFVDNTVKAVQDAGKNIEANFQDTGKFFGEIFRGNFNNLGESIVRSTMAGATGMMINPKDKRRIGGEASFERRAREGQEAADKAAAQDLANQNAELLRQNAAVFSGAAEARKRAPGRSMTLLNQSGSPRNTLLTVMGS